jgi:hypothetical protein
MLLKLSVSTKILPVPDDSFKEFVPDQLGALPELRTRAMFGAHGLWPVKNFRDLNKTMV